jgi:hypothetical protein
MYIITVVLTFRKSQITTGSFHENRQGLLRVFEIRGTNSGYFIREWAVPMFLTAKLGWGRNPHNSGSIRVFGGYFILFIRLPVLVFDRLFKTKRELPVPIFDRLFKTKRIANYKFLGKNII